MRTFICTGLLGLAAFVGLAASATPAHASDWGCYGGGYGYSTYGYGGGYVERHSYYRSYPAYRYDDCDRGYYGGSHFGVSIGVVPRYSHYDRHHHHHHHDHFRGGQGHGRGHHRGHFHGR